MLLKVSVLGLNLLRHWNIAALVRYGFARVLVTGKLSSEVQHKHHLHFLFSLMVLGVDWNKMTWEFCTNISRRLCFQGTWSLRYGSWFFGGEGGGGCVWFLCLCCWVFFNIFCLFISYTLRAKIPRTSTFLPHNPLSLNFTLGILQLYCFWSTDRKSVV